MDYNILRAIGGGITIIGTIMTIYAQYNLSKTPKVDTTSVKDNEIEDVSGNGSAGIEINRVKTEASEIAVEKNKVRKIKEGGKGVVVNESTSTQDSKSLKSDNQGKITLTITNSNFENISGNAEAIVIEAADGAPEINVETKIEGNNIKNVKKGAKAVRVKKAKKQN